MPKLSSTPPSTAEANKRVLWRWSTVCSKAHGPPDMAGYRPSDPDGCHICRVGWWTCVTHLKEECEDCPDE